MNNRAANLATIIGGLVGSTYLVMAVGWTVFGVCLAISCATAAVAALVTT